MSATPDPSHNDSTVYDDRDYPKELFDDDAPPVCGIIEERAENTHIGFSEDDPAIEEIEPTATFETQR